MKNWLSIGQFAKRAGVSARTLRVYEEVDLIRSHVRGENGYRYYQLEQLELIHRIVAFKKMGFSLSEIKTLLEADKTLDAETLRVFLSRRLQNVILMEKNLSTQKDLIQNILSSLKQNHLSLRPNERKFIMSHFENIAIVVTGIRDLQLTAEYIRNHLLQAGRRVEIFSWSENFEPPIKKPYILIIPEAFLTSNKVSELRPDLVVIKNLSAFNSGIQESYLKLYRVVGPHMTTVFNADDRISVELAANPEIQKGRMFYFSKNSGLESQIQKIGGVVSDGEEVNIFGLNLSKDKFNVKLKAYKSFDEEVALLASLAAVMDIGLDAKDLRYE